MSERRTPPPPALEAVDDHGPASAANDVDALESDEALAALLRAADAPDALDEEVHARILARALGTLPEAAALPAAAIDPTSAEAAEAEALRDRLGRGWALDPEAEPDDPIESLVASAAALRAAARPQPIEPLRAQRALATAGLSGRKGARGRIVWGVVALVAVAAAVAMVPQLGGAARDVTAALVPARSTQALFDPAEPFPREGGASDRIDRIAASRRGDLRENRFARWGIR